MNNSNFLLMLAEEIESNLKRLGFIKSSDSLFVRFKQHHEINVVFIQKHSSKSMISVNLGVHYDFLPKVGSTDFPEQGKVELPDCEIKLRLTPDEGVSDYWWPMISSSIGEISLLLDAKVELSFAKYDIDRDIGRISLDDIENNLSSLLPSTTKVRACLLLARLHETVGDRALAIDFARLGIKMAGMAVGPKKALKQIIERLDS
jgi:hypothetical protein